MKSRLAELKALADEIAAAIDWKEPWQRRAFDDGVIAALKTAHKALNEPCRALTKERHGDRVVEREIEVIPYPINPSDGGDA